MIVIGSDARVIDSPRQEFYEKLGSEKRFRNRRRNA